MEKVSLSLYWSARLISVIILVQTLFFKFSGAEESIYIFTTVGMEPWGRIGIAILELVAAVLLLFNKTALFGGVLALGLMLGAIGMHLTKLGISVQGDGGYLFFLAVLVAVCSAFVLLRNKAKIESVIRFLAARLRL
ncbi:MAG TPA: DoxX family protein, partial [Chryseolinea sp.]|nr:DoxX family protein [Chryseolinea sp.]